MTKDLTVGKPLRLIWQFSVPLIFGNLFQQLYNIIDTVIVGRYLGLSALTAVGSTGSIIFLIVGFCMGTCAGLGVPVAQQFGAKDFSAMRKYVMNGVYFAIFIAVALTIVTCLLCNNILTWMSTPDTVFRDAYDYLFVIFLGIPFTILYNVVSGIIRAMGDSKTPFYFLVLSTVLNIVLDLLLIIVFQMGVRGAAVATITAQAVSGVTCLIYMRRKYDILKCRPEEREFHIRYVKTLAGMSVPMGLQFSITAIGSILLQTAVNALPAACLSAYVAASKVTQLSMSPFDGISNATATFGSQNLGAREYKRVRQGLRAGIFIAAIYAIGIGIVMFFAGAKVTMLFVSGDETEVLRLAQQLLTVSGACYWLLAILNPTRLTIQGLGYSAIAMFAGLSELAARGVMSLFVIPKFGYNAACFTNPLAWVAAVLVVVPVFIVIMRRIERRGEGARIAEG